MAALQTSLFPHSSASESPIRAIAFYLPQFHPIPENDLWWGRGFTEWTNVARAEPQFPGHYQPHIPGSLGFYDLRLPETRQAQADLAREYGIHGFCYYHYWFNGRRVLERPFNEVLESGKPDFPFCLCWANENWTRGWDGGDKHLLLEQQYGEKDDIAHIKSLTSAFQDRRYIRINGKPLFLVYRTELLPDPAKTAATWRSTARQQGVGEIFLARVESHGTQEDPRDLGFDAAVQFAPALKQIGEYKYHGKFHSLLAKIGLLSKGFLENSVGDYNVMRAYFLQRKQPDFVQFQCVMPAWDNTARRKPAWILLNASPAAYEEWLRVAVDRCLSRHQGDERIVFVNAWNEWGEGNHLEPDLKWGRAYLEATKRALTRSDASAGVPSPGSPMRVKATSDLSSATPRYAVAKKSYWEMRSRLGRFVNEQLELLTYVLRGKK